MQVHVQKWGNSLGLRIPKALAVEAGIELGSAVDVSLDVDRLVVRAVRVPSYTLAHLVEGITEENMQSEIDSGPAVGEEVW
ncbi:MAG: AbrB/MazE/SpoVT family DNA-binding domain-containing protein [Gemmatimonadota bacterium]|jgi:antitoxin MazE|nr:AbrB/MazE/SpoVT family DNA-binding domain-containing protein [Gemmatimonadota bacterium]